MKKNLEISQKVVRYYFFPIKIKQTLFPLWGGGGGGELFFY